jgi:hypothetical protein
MHLLVYTTANKDHFESDPPLHEPHKSIPNTMLYLTIVCHRTVGEGKPLRIP